MYNCSLLNAIETHNLIMSPLENNCGFATSLQNQLLFVEKPLII